MPNLHPCQNRQPGLTFPRQPSILTVNMTCAEVAEQADAHDSKSCGLNALVGSIPSFGIFYT